MLPESFYGQIVDIFTKPPQARHAAMLNLHARVMADYIAAVERITEVEARQPVSVGTDTRTLGEVVGHIAEWERFGIMAAGDILAGLDHPRTVTDVRGFVDSAGQVHDFADVHEFNAYQKQRYTHYTWPQLQQAAIEFASTLYGLFAHPQLLTSEKLDRTKPHRKRLYNGALLDDTTMGWCLWVIYLDHEAVEHALELNLPAS